MNTLIIVENGYITNVEQVKYASDLSSVSDVFNAVNQKQSFTVELMVGGSIDSLLGAISHIEIFEHSYSTQAAGRDLILNYVKSTLEMFKK